MRILLADDSVTAQNMGKKILAEAGHEVICVSNGAAALKKVGEQEPELVILDIYMPGYSGLEVCQRLKENPGTAGLPVVLTVGKLEPFRKEDAQRVRAEALIVKPFEASELQSAVARLAKLAGSARPIPKSKGKPGPQPQAQPEQFSADDYVTASQKEKQKEQEQEPEPVAGAPVEVSQEAEARPERQPESLPQAREFEVTAQAEFSPPVDGGGGFGATFDTQESGVAAESNLPASAHTEFRPQSQEPASLPREAEIQPTDAKAAAAAAGADSGTASQMPAASAGAMPHQDFVIAAPSEPQGPEGYGFTPGMASDAGVPELSSAAAPGFTVTEEPAVVPPVDPAFDPDRTQWATQFATRFGIQEKAPAEQPEAEQSQEPEPAAMPTPPDEIAAILSNLPGGMGDSQQPEPNEVGEEFGQRPWPLDAPLPAHDHWKAEEVPVEDGDSSVSLADEMEKAFGEHRPPSTVSEAEKQAAREEAQVAAVQPAEERQMPAEEPAALQAPAEESGATPGEAMEANSSSAPGEAVGESGAAPGEAVEANSSSAPGETEVKIQPPSPDRVAGVMQSAAMAIATRATVSAVASQLHTQPAAESATTGPSAIEELVGQVLERLKPKLIAEITRELKTPGKD